eukprot:TRINITY_DN15353_c0_g1_i2.p1 TRINITY_DN15353_c0_g1~~TRINITY_DN15353_c0_g1_i2.p1  ORF type:complete len:1197 (-),score=257.42 TRINITY_DN15353_c0_g1_i2:276-3500(-)
MIEANNNKVFVLPAKPEVHKVLGHCEEDEFFVAMRETKDAAANALKQLLPAAADAGPSPTKAATADKAAEEVPLPKYKFFRGRADVPPSVLENLKRSCFALEVEGVCLGWQLSPPESKFPSGCEPVGAGAFGQPEPLSSLVSGDVSGGPDHPYYRVSLRRASRLMSHKVRISLRLLFETTSVLLFMLFVGTRPAVWDSNSFFGDFATAGFEPPSLWTVLWGVPEHLRAPNLELVWRLYRATFFLFLISRCAALLIWRWLPAGGGWRVQAARHVLAAIYPLAVTMPLHLYLLYHLVAVANCAACSRKDCADPSVKLSYAFDAQAFARNNGCASTKRDDLLGYFSFHQHVSYTSWTAQPSCFYQEKGVMRWLGVQDGTSGGDVCADPQLSYPTIDKSVRTSVEKVCGEHFDYDDVFKYNTTEIAANADTWPWWMFAKKYYLFGPLLPVETSRTCTDVTESGKYLYFDMGLQSTCLCYGEVLRYCFRWEAGGVNACSDLTGRPYRFGSSLQYSGITGPWNWATFLGIYKWIAVVLCLWVWSDWPISNPDKSNERLLSRLVLDLLDCALFFDIPLKKAQQQVVTRTMFFDDTTWRSLTANVWCLAWMSTLLWAAFQIFADMFDTDPLVTPKRWGSSKEVKAELSDRVGELCSRDVVHSVADESIANQRSDFEKAIQKLIAVRSVVDILDEGVSPDRAWPWHWRKAIIVFSSPAVSKSALGSSDSVILYLADFGPFAERPPERVWTSESLEEYLETRAEEGSEAEAPADLSASSASEVDESADEEAQVAAADGHPRIRGLRRVELRFDEVLTRLRQSSGYYWLDPRYLGFFTSLDNHTTFQQAKLLEEDPNVFRREPYQCRKDGKESTSWYYDPNEFDWFERRMEAFAVLRSLLCLELPFLIVRFYQGYWVKSSGGSSQILLIMKNSLFVIFDLVFLLACGNAALSCSFGSRRPLQRILLLIERTYIGRAVRLSALMPIRVALECMLLPWRVRGEEQVEYLQQRKDLVALRRQHLRCRASKGEADARAAEEDAKELEALNHEVRLLSTRIAELKEEVGALDTSKITYVLAKADKKSLLG